MRAQMRTQPTYTHTMRRSKSVCPCDQSLCRALFLSPIFVIMLICFWASYAVLLPLSVSLWKDCSSEEGVSCHTLLVSIRGGHIHVQTAAATEVLLHPGLPLKLEASNSNTIPAMPLLDILASRHDREPLSIEEHTPVPAAPAAVPVEAGDHPKQDNISTMQDDIQHQHQQQQTETSVQIALVEVSKQMQDLRRASNSLQNAVNTAIKQEFGSNCEGKRVFIYDLPAKFNVDLLNMCHKLIPWQNMCNYLSNSGMGRLLEFPAPQDGQEEVLVPAGLWYQTHQYALEIIFHERLKQYKCLVRDPELADMLYIPYYGGLDVLRWHFVNNSTNAQRDELGMQLIEWLKEQPAWRKNRGADHVLVLGKISWDFRRWPTGDHWGSSLLVQEEMQNLTKLLIERQPWHEHDVGVPHPTFFHPRHDRDIRTWQGHIDGADRKYLVSFAGMPRPQHSTSIRSQLIKQCLDSINGSSWGSSCYFLPCVENACLHPNTTMGLFIHSEFCMQPPGDSPTRRSVFDSLIAGCIPVLFDPFTAYYQYPWHLPEDPKAYSVYFPAEDVREGKINVVEELHKIPTSVRREMRLRIIYDIMPGLVYARPGARLREVEDAFLISLRSLFKRISERLNRESEEA